MEKKMIKSVLFLLIASMSIVGFGESAEAANYPLNIMNIDDARINNRIKFAYTRLEYNIRVAVEGGSYPSTYELTTAPTGMVIDSFTGEIIWSNPTSGSHNCTVKVIDSENNMDSESWTIQVINDVSNNPADRKFHFLDAINGDDLIGDGSIDNPWQTLDAVYESKHISSFAGAGGDIIIMRNGTYILPDDSSGAELEGSYKTWLRSAISPTIYLAYPEETVNISHYTGSRYNHWTLDDGDDDFYFYDLDFIKVYSYGIMFDSESKYFTAYKCDFKDGQSTDGHNNQAYVCFQGYGSVSENCVIQNCAFEGISVGSMGAIKSYGLYYSVVEDNTIWDMDSGDQYGIAMKAASEYNTIRHNSITNCLRGIVSEGYNRGYTGVNENEYSFNYLKEASGANEWDAVVYFDITSESDGEIGTSYFFRNTIDGHVSFKDFAYTDGIVTFMNNVIQNDYSDSAAIGDNSFDRHHTRFGFVSDDTYNERFIYEDNLEAMSNIVNSNGNLTEAYSSYLGTHGWQIARGPNTTTPTRSNPSPTGTLSSGTTSTNISLTTNIQSTCRYSNVSGTNYTEMPFNFTYTNSTNHSAPVTGLENGQTYIYYIRCNSSDCYVNDDDFNITFSVDGHKADINDDGVINMPELMVFIGRWKAGDGVSRAEVEEARDIWFAGGVY